MKALLRRLLVFGFLFPRSVVVLLASGPLQPPHSCAKPSRTKAVEATILRPAPVSNTYAAQSLLSTTVVSVLPQPKHQTLRREKEETSEILLTIYYYSAETQPRSCAHTPTTERIAELNEAAFFPFAFCLHRADTQSLPARLTQLLSAACCCLIAQLYAAMLRCTACLPQS